VTNLILILGIAFILLSVSISQSAFADGTIDQNNLGKPLSGSVLIPHVPPLPRFGQIFTPTAESLDAVEIEIVTLSLTGTEQEITVNVHQGNTFGVPAFQHGTATLPLVCDPSCVIHIDLPAPITLVPGLPHILEIIPKNTGMEWFLANANDPYPGGDVIAKLSVPPFNSAEQLTVDLIFATLFLKPCEVDTIPFKIDHYLGYNAKTTKKTPKFDEVTVELSDQFGSGIFKVEKTTRLYNPVQKTTQDGCEFLIKDKVTHLKAYKIKVAQNNVLVKNQFGELIVTTSKAELLLVPTAKSHDDPDVSELASPLVDHYKCYKVKIDKNAPLQFEPLQVTLFDPNFNAEKVFDVIKPKWLCNPVDKNGEEIMNPTDHLMCYDVEPADGFKKNKKRSVFTNNQFGPEQLDVKKEKELCVPSEKTLLE